MRSARRLAAVATVVLAGLAGPAAGMPGDGGAMVSIGYSTYDPATVDVVTGDTVAWTNDSVRKHTVTADEGGFDSGVLATGNRFERRFDAAGAYPYHCTLHPTIRGEVDVHDLLLERQPLPAAPGRPFPLRGRAAPVAGPSVEIQADEGSGFASVATAPVADDGSFAVTVTPTTTTTYRAVAGDLQSPPVQLIVLDRRVTTRTRRRGVRFTVTATVTPPSPGATVVLQLRLRDRFGWWPVARGHLDGTSAASLRTRLRKRVPARVVLTLPDGATPVAISPTFHLGG